MEQCPCGSGIDYNECCRPLIHENKLAATVEALMRSRYTAYTESKIDYIQNTTHPSQRSQFDLEATRDWAENSEWQKLEILDVVAGTATDKTGEVEFIATYIQKGTVNKHHERALFKKVDGSWFFLDGKRVKAQPVVRSAPKIGRNDPCLCGSGKKYKKCCGE